MKIHSLTLIIQDFIDKDTKKPYAGVYGKLTLNTEEQAQNEDGTLKFDEEKDPVYMMEDIPFGFNMDKSSLFRSEIQAMMIEALTLKNLEIAKENGQVSHFVQKMKSLLPKSRRGARTTAPKKRK